LPLKTSQPGRHDTISLWSISAARVKMANWRLIRPSAGTRGI